MRTLGRLALLVTVAAAVWAFTAWPRINDVETGRTPEYPDLQVRTYAASAEKVAQVLQQSIPRLSRWTLVGVGHGPAGTSVQAVHETRVFRFKDDVSIRIWREGGKTRVSVRSRSRLGKGDFGQNARNIRELLAALDRELPRNPSG